MTCGVYAIQNMTNGKRYIGGSKNIELRIQHHFYQLSIDKHYNYELQDEYNDFGKESFTSEVLKICPEDDLVFTERYFIELYRTYKSEKGYNNNIICYNPRIKEETKMKMSMAKKNFELEDFIRRSGINLRTLQRVKANKSISKTLLSKILTMPEEHEFLLNYLNIKSFTQLRTFNNRGR